MSLGFAAGVMVAASYWSLLSPAIEMATESKYYGPEGEYAFVPVGIGFLIGAAFVYGTDALITALGIQSPNVLLAMQSVGTKKGTSVVAKKRQRNKLKSDKEDDDFRDSKFFDVRSSFDGHESTTIDGTTLPDRYFFILH